MSTASFFRIPVAAAGSLAVLTLTAALNAATVYVNASADGANTGENWNDAFTDLQDALAEAQPGDQIWVAAGWYAPDAPGGSIDATFALVDQVALFGGFAGWETQFNQRDIEANETVLTGNLEYSVSGSSYVLHVVTAANVGPRARLDGFIIRDGAAWEWGALDDSGGGMIVIDASPTIANCTFIDNSALFGGGLAVLGGEPRIVNSAFFDNFGFEGGGGIYIEGDNSLAVITSTTFESNDTFELGGGLFVYQGGAVMEDVLFTDNLATWNGGAFENWDGFIECDDCSIIANIADAGAGAAFGGSGLITLRNSEVRDNIGETAVFGGGAGAHLEMIACDITANSGGVYWQFGGTATFINCRITDHAYTFEGAGLNYQGPQLIMVNTLVARNDSSFPGGGVFISGNAEIINSTIIDNSAAAGGGIYIVDGSVAVLNSIVWGNLSWDEVQGTLQDINGPATVEYSIVGDTEYTGPGVIHDDPIFADADGRLAHDSPAIDAGANDFLPQDIFHDLDGNRRFIDGNGDGQPIVDMGAYELQKRLAITRTRR